MIASCTVGAEREISSTTGFPFSSNSEVVVLSQIEICLPTIDAVALANFALPDSVNSRATTGWLFSGLNEGKHSVVVVFNLDNELYTFDTVRVELTIRKKGANDGGGSDNSDSSDDQTDPDNP